MTTLTRTPARHLRRWGPRLGLATLASAAALGVGEAWARAARLEPSELSAPSKPLCRPLDDASGLRYELVPYQRSRQTLGAWADRPARRITYSVNRDGYRGLPVQRPKPAEEFRILAVGDSFTFGSIVDDDETFPAQLERELTTRFPERSVRVVNLGVPGYQIRQAHETLERRTLPFEPDLVLLTLYVNDPIPTAPTYDGRAEDLDAGAPALEQVWIQRLGLSGGMWDLPADASPQERVVAWFRERSSLADRLAQDLYRRLSLRSSMRLHRRRWSEHSSSYRRVVETIERGAELGRRHGFDFHVAMYPMLSQLDDYPLAEVHARLAATCEERGVPFHDLLPVLEPHSPIELWAHEQDHHPNALCHGLVAHQLATALATAISG